MGFSRGWRLQRSRAAQLNVVGPADITTSSERDDIVRRVVMNPGVGDGVGAGQVHALRPQGAAGGVESQSAGAKGGLVAEGEDTALEGGSVGVGVGVVQHQGARVVALDDGAADTATGNHGVDDEIVEGRAVVDREGPGGVAKAEVSVDHRLAADVVSHGAPQGERASTGADGSAGHGEGADAVTLVVGCQIEEAAMVHGDGDSANLVRAGGGSVAHRGGARERVVNRQRAVDCGRRSAGFVEFQDSCGHGDGTGSGVGSAAAEDQGAIAHLGVVLGRNGGVQRQPAVRLHADGGGAAHGEGGRIGADGGVAVNQFQGPLAVIVVSGAVEGDGLVTQIQRAGEGIDHQSGAGFDRGPTRGGAEGGIAGNFEGSVAHGHGSREGVGRVEDESSVPFLEFHTATRDNPAHGEPGAAGSEPQSLGRAKGDIIEDQIVTARVDHLSRGHGERGAAGCDTASIEEERIDGLGGAKGLRGGKLYVVRGRGRREGSHKSGVIDPVGAVSDEFQSGGRSLVQGGPSQGVVGNRRQSSAEKNLMRSRAEVGTLRNKGNGGAAAADQPSGGNGGEGEIAAIVDRSNHRGAAAQIVGGRVDGETVDHLINRGAGMALLHQGSPRQGHIRRVRNATANGRIDGRRVVQKEGCSRIDRHRRRSRQRAIRP